MTRPKLVTFDVYMALLDIQGSLVPVVSDELNLEANDANAFVQLWRAKQMERAAISNSLDRGRTSFRAATEMALEYVAGRHGLEIEPDKRKRLVAARRAAGGPLELFSRVTGPPRRCSCPSPWWSVS